MDCRRCGRAPGHPHALFFTVSVGRSDADEHKVAHTFRCSWSLCAGCVMRHRRRRVAALVVVAALILFGAGLVAAGVVPVEKVLADESARDDYPLFALITACLGLVPLGFALRALFEKHQEEGFVSMPLRTEVHCGLI